MLSTLRISCLEDAIESHRKHIRDLTRHIDNLERKLSDLTQKIENIETKLNTILEETNGKK